jgi:hypothetical protein
MWPSCYQIRLRAYLNKDTPHTSIFQVKTKKTNKLFDSGEWGMGLCRERDAALLFFSIVFRFKKNAGRTEHPAGNHSK